MERFANNASTTLVDALDNTTDPVTFTVTDATNFPNSGNFRIIIENEILLVTTVSGNDFTANRAQEGTTIASHASSTVVTHIVTAESLSQLVSDRIQYGTLASLPSPGQANRLYLPTDGNCILFDDGSSWRKIVNNRLLDYSSDYSLFGWNNQGTATLTTRNDGILFQDIGGGSDNIRTYVRSTPTPPYKFTALILGTIYPGGIGAVGLALRNSSTGQLKGFYTGRNNDARLEVAHFNAFNSFAGVAATTNFYTASPIFLRIEDDNTNLIYSYSFDGINFVFFFKQTRTTFFTADQVGLWVNPFQGTAEYKLHVYGYKVE